MKTEKGKFNNSKHKYAYAALAVIVLYLLPFLLLWQDSPIVIHDTLDNWVANVKVLSESGQAFAGLDAIVPNIMNGLPRNTLVSEFNFFLWSSFFFEFFTAYVVNIALMHIVAFVGMYLLLKNHFLKEKKYELLVVGVALAFALLPFNPLRVLSIAAQPLLLYAFLNIRNNEASKKDWLIIVLFPFFSDFILAGVFFLFGLAMLWAYDFFKTRKINYRFFMAIALMILIFVVLNYRLIFNMFLDSSYVSHRIEFEGYPTDIIRVLARSARAFIFGQYHSASLHHYFVFLAVAIAIAASCLKKARAGLLLKLLTIVLAISVFCELINGWRVLEPLKDQVSILVTFTFSRFNSLFPLLWYIIFALSLQLIFDKVKHGRQIALILIVLQVGFLFSYTEPVVQSGGLGLILSEGLTFKEFYSVDLFQEIADYIGKEQSSYRVVSIGMHPAIAQYTGFYTLDSYQSNYPLAYKHRFRKIIEKELDKSPTHLKRYFDTWGSRCYVWVNELSGKYLYTKDKDAKVNNLELNTAALKEMGGEYVLSAVEIANHADNNLALLRVFESERSPWKIWLYKVE